MKATVLVLLGLIASNAHAATCKSNYDIAGIFGRGIFATMDRETVASNPDAKIVYLVQESHASTPQYPIFKIFRSIDNGRSPVTDSCGIVMAIEKGVPTLESDIDCGN